MESTFFRNNRDKLYAMLPEGSMIAIFSGKDIIKTNDEYYPFFADRNFVYLTGIECKEAVLLAAKDGSGKVDERLYILPPDDYAERWTGIRVKPAEAEALSGATDIRSTENFIADFRKLAIEADCKMYAPENCTVYADNRIIGIFPKNDVEFTLELGENSVNGEHGIELKINAKGAEYFIYD